MFGVNRRHIGDEATMPELKRRHGMGKLRVRKAAKVGFAVACKVIACNTKRWAKAHTASGEALNALHCTGMFGVNIYKYALAH